MVNEIWRDIDEFSRQYQISNLGRVKSLDRLVFHRGNGEYHLLKGKLLSTRNNNCGYVSVRLSKNGKTYTRFIHRLLSSAFIPNPQNKKCINHLNGIKTDNRLENLMWSSHKENIVHAYETELIKPKSKKVIDKCSGEIFENVKAAAASINRNYNTVRQYLNGGIKKNPTCLKYLKEAA